MKITNYTVLHAESPQELAALTQEAINKHGWQPLGGASISTTQHRKDFIQAIVKYEDDKKLHHK